MCNKEQGFYQSQLSDDSRAKQWVGELTKAFDRTVEKFQSLPAAPNHLTGNIEPLPHVYNFKQEK